MKVLEMAKAQIKLMDHIAAEHPEKPGEDRFEKRLLALNVEVAECANEYRGFKFWSKDQAPRTKKARAPYMDLDDADFYNPLLEEYVDGFHFVLDIGISKDWYFYEYEFPEGSNDIDGAFLLVFDCISELRYCRETENFNELMASYLRLGAALGFTEEEIEAAYFKKNEINHGRQNSGY